MMPAPHPDQRLTYRACPLCEAICGLEIRTRGGEVTGVRGDDRDPFSRGHVCPKAVALIDVHHDPDPPARPRAQDRRPLAHRLGRRLRSDRHAPRRHPARPRPRTRSRSTSATRTRTTWATSCTRRTRARAAHEEPLHRHQRGPAPAPRGRARDVRAHVPAAHSRHRPHGVLAGARR
ncbi:MAG: hypothetical protein IPH30_16870 [Betaproteobacteria bacterium]|nr:hypothetical protein [Betaproteobacteria bacterium]